MARRTLRLAAIVVLLVLTMPSAAFAEYSVELVSPASGVVSGSGEVQIRVAREPLDSEVRSVRVRAARGGGDAHQLTCLSGCDTRQPVYGFAFDPRRGDPFGVGPMSNGAFQFETLVSPALGEDRNVGTLTLQLRVPGSAVSGLSTSVDDQQVRLAWSRAPEPDIDGYRVERCRGGCGGDGWSARGERLSASASSFEERVRPGTYSYRVVTIRSNGGDGTIETVSSAVTAEVEEPPAPTPDDTETPDAPGDDGDGDGDADGDAGDRDDGATGRDDDGDDGPDRDRDGDDEDGDGGTAGGSSDRSFSTSRTRTGRAPSVSFGGQRGVPALPDAADVFRGSLDYGLDDPETADARGDAPGPGDDDEVVLSAPGGSSGSFLGRLTDPNRIAVPIAGGMLMTAIGLHLWRWLRVPV
ncbi:MAG: hypothetical protein WEB09_05660 [Nitriliruptor sp.]